MLRRTGSRSRHSSCPRWFRAGSTDLSTVGRSSHLLAGGCSKQVVPNVPLGTMTRFPFHGAPEGWLVSAESSLRGNHHWPRCAFGAKKWSRSIVVIRPEFGTSLDQGSRTGPGSSAAVRRSQIRLEGLRSVCPVVVGLKDAKSRPSVHLTKTTLVPNRGTCTIVLEPETGVEPATCCLQDSCSTN